MNEKPNEPNWEPTTARFALASRVLIVAVTRIEGAWSAYCDAVPGIRHDDEWEEVWRTGTKIPEKMARALFPQFEDLPYNA